MKGKNLTVLVVVAFVLVGWAYFGSRREGRPSESSLARTGKPAEDPRDGGG